MTRWKLIQLFISHHTNCTRCNIDVIFLHKWVGAYTFLRSLLSSSSSLKCEEKIILTERWKSRFQCTGIYCIYTGLPSGGGGQLTHLWGTPAAGEAWPLGSLTRSNWKLPEPQTSLVIGSAGNSSTCSSFFFCNAQSLLYLIQSIRWALRKSGWGGCCRGEGDGDT